MRVDQTGWERKEQEMGTENYEREVTEDCPMSVSVSAKSYFILNFLIGIYASIVT